ncbi:hypothetical protein QJQ45_001530 [Haematococcus lacustris]|nr:hypothetical protein QJQ45_001530 [Haematococcus lacustris]
MVRRPVDFGLQGNLYRVRCTACDLVLNSHLHTIQKHEDSARHKQNLAAKQKSSAAVQAFKAALTTGRDRAAAKRKEQMEDSATVTQFAAVKLGRPMTDIEHTPDLLHHIAAAKQKLTAAAQAVVQDLRHRFVAGRHAKALAIVYPNYWDTKPSDEDFLERLEAIKQLYCQQACLSDGTEVLPSSAHATVPIC